MADETADYVAITRLQAAYADVVTRRAWPELEPLFVADAEIHIDTVTQPVIEVRGAKALGDFISRAIERFSFFEFVVLNTVIDVSTTSARLYMVELRQDGDTGEWSNAFGLYRDRYERYDGGWRFAERHYQSLARQVGTEPAEVFPFPAN